MLYTHNVGKYIKEYIASKSCNNNIEISIITTNYNGSKYTLEMINSIYKNKIIDSNNYAEIIIVDNGSSEYDYNRLKYALKTISNNLCVKIVRLSKNYGPCMGYNIGVLLSRGKYILLVNNDVVFPSNFSLRRLARLLDRLARFNVGALTVKVLKAWNPSIIDTAGTIVDKLLYTCEYGEYDSGDKNEYNKLYYVQSIPLVFMFTRRSDFIKAGMLDPYYFAGYEDLDLSLRMQLLNGKKLIYIPTISIYHHRGGTSSRPDFKYSMAYLFSRGYIVNVLTYLPLARALIAIAVRALLTLVYSIIKREPLTLYYRFIIPLFRVMRDKYFAVKRKFVNKHKHTNAELHLYNGIVLLKKPCISQ